MHDEAGGKSDKSNSNSLPSDEINSSPHPASSAPLQPHHFNGQIDGRVSQPRAESASGPPSPQTLQLWREVSEGLDRNSTVVWTKAVESLEVARRHLQPPQTSPEARTFVDECMHTIISILLEQSPNKIGMMERDCVEKSIKCALTIVRDDLETIVESNYYKLQICTSLPVLYHIFQKKKTYYKGSKANWSPAPSGLPEVRNHMITLFKRLRGFHCLGLYLKARAIVPNADVYQHNNKQQQQQQHPQQQPHQITSHLFPTLDTILVILEAVKDCIPQQHDRSMNESNNNESQDQQLQILHTEQDALLIATSVMEHVSFLDEETLKRLSSDSIKITCFHLQRIYERVALSNPRAIFEYYVFSRALVLKLITSASLPLKLSGWTTLEEIIETSVEKHPPPPSIRRKRRVLPEENNCDSEDNPARLGNATVASPFAAVGAGKTLTLFRCTMRSQQRWWFISEADEDQPGTDKDIDYYNHKSKPHEEAIPSSSGWVTCRSGVDPAPSLTPVGLMVPDGEEYNTLEHELAKWAIENKVIELVLGDSIHREIVSRSTALIKFLASMCDKDDPSEAAPGDMKDASSNISSMQTERSPNQYCLKASHLLFAWKTCMSKTDAAVSAEIYNLLVSILPSLPEDLAIPLVRAVHESLKQTSDKGNHNFSEVSEFCCAIANISDGYTKTNNVDGFLDHISKIRIREEILNLQWAILSHEDSWSLKSCEVIKHYVSSEISRLGAAASSMRNKFLFDCRDDLVRNSENFSAANESQALYVVQLTKFVVESYPRDTKVDVLMFTNGDDKRSLAELLLLELTAYLHRRGIIPTAPPLRKPSSTSVVVLDFNHSNALRERLLILRFVYGLSSTTEMTSQQLDHLWSLCNSPLDREVMMEFLHEASVDLSGAAVRPENYGVQMSSADKLYAAFSDEVKVHVFEELFCAENVRWESLGSTAFGSFQSLFSSVSEVRTHVTSKARALDALWRICLSAGNDQVATNAMIELLRLYGEKKLSIDSYVHNKESNGGLRFSERIFECLFNVKEGLQRGDGSSVRSAERCIKILKRAFNMGTLGGCVGAVAERLRSLPDSDLEVYLKEIPHGLRGASSCIRVSVTSKECNSTSEGRAIRFPLEIHLLQTLSAIKMQVADYCKTDFRMVKLHSHTGRTPVPRLPPRSNFGSIPNSTLAGDLGITDGCDILFLLVNEVNDPGIAPPSPNTFLRNDVGLDLSPLFKNDSAGNTFGIFFDTLIAVLESLPVTNDGSKEIDSTHQIVDSHSLVWDLVLAMPTNARVCESVQKAATEGGSKDPHNSSDAMVVDSEWSALIDFQHFERSVYVLQVLDFSLRPPPHLLSCLPFEKSLSLSREMSLMAQTFRSDFITSGGFEAVLRLFVESGTSEKKTRRRNRMGNECALRILSNCFLVDDMISKEGLSALETFPKIGDFLKSLMYIIVDDEGVADAAILRVLRLIEAMLKSGQRITTGFNDLPEKVTENFFTSLLLWEGSSLSPASIQSATQIRKKTEEMILETPFLSSSAMPFLVTTLGTMDSFTDGSTEFFSVLMKLVASAKDRTSSDTVCELEELGTALCYKLAMYPRPTSDNEHIDYSTGVLCGCLRLLVALIDSMGGVYVRKGSQLLLHKLQNKPWSDPSEENDDTRALIDLMGSIFDCSVSSAQSPGSPAMCCDKESRRLAFDVIATAAQACQKGAGFTILVRKISRILSDVAPSLRHSWGHSLSLDSGHNQRSSNTVKYSGLKNQGCTCYMNSVLQQLFMMPTLRKMLCSAESPASLRSSGSGDIAEGSALTGKTISLHWDCGSSYDAVVDNFDERSGMHIVSYLQIQPSAPVGQRQQLPDLSSLPAELPEQFILSEGRPGMETGAFDIVSDGTLNSSRLGDHHVVIVNKTIQDDNLSETEDESSSRKLLEEVQRTFVNLDEARGRCFDPRSLVEASNCLKLEFDVWQQNDASEFAMKLLDRLEISLKRWSPLVFKYLAHTFGLKTTKQKICKECGLKTSREENLMNIDCQIRNKSNIHEALSSLCEDEIMEGDNKVLCDSCKVKTNTVLRTAISALPDVLVLSLKRFDLDYTTFETVKLNSRCEFGQALNMKQYTLEAKELIEAAAMTEEPKSETGSMMDIGEADAIEEASKDPLSKLPDEDYQYYLVGVLVHAGVAQGGHYYSFIKDRTSDKWYRFDDEDVTPFDPSSIEHECFGGTVKKETKFPNGHVHTVENELFANALMLFYEKVKPTQMEDNQELKETLVATPMDEEGLASTPKLSLSNGYDIFLPIVRKSNSTHSWQSFLLTDEFQSFLREILCLSIDQSPIRYDDMDYDIVSVFSYPPLELESWRFGVIELALKFIFDVLLHLSLDRKVMTDWSEKIIEVFFLFPVVTEAFVSDLAKRSRCVYENWIREYTTESSDVPSRRIALQIISAAIHKQLTQVAEQTLLQNWTHGWNSAWQEKMNQIRGEKRVASMPTQLEAANFARLEDISSISRTATSVGIILSHISLLLELSPRMAQSRVDLFYLIQLLSKIEGIEGQLLRNALTHAQFPARLLCLAWRERSHDVLRALFPGSCLSCDLADAISKHETNSSNIVQIGMNSSGLNHGGGSMFAPSPNDNRLLFEALGSIMGMPWCILEDVAHDTGEVIRGRSIQRLTPLVINALSAVFEESKSSAKGMSKRDFHNHMKKCGVRDVPQQKIEAIMNKYALLDDGVDSKVIPLSGFLEYYQHYSIGNQQQVLKELQTFGFRPNLSRIPDNIRWHTDEVTALRHQLTLQESIAADVAMNHLMLTKNIPFIEYVLWDPHFLYFTMENSSSKIATQYIHAAYAIDIDPTRIINNFLNVFHRYPGQWNSESYHTCYIAFALLCAIPDEKQQDRISAIMINGTRDEDGLMAFGMKLLERHPNDYNSTNRSERYVNMIRDLRKLQMVAKWMNAHRSHWTWMEPEGRLESMNPQQSRGDHSVRRGGANQHQSVPHSDNSDDEYEYEDDEDSRFDQEHEFDDIIVEGCGVQEINGTYKKCGHCDNVPKYSKTSLYQGLEEDFVLFRCKLSDNTRRWYISIVPGNIHPGTTKDIDFYFAPNRSDSCSFPPTDGWSVIPQRGAEPAPRLTPKNNEWNEEQDEFL